MDNNYEDFEKTHKNYQSLKLSQKIVPALWYTFLYLYYF